MEVLLYKDLKDWRNGCLEEKAAISPIFLCSYFALFTDIALTRDDRTTGTVVKGFLQFRSQKIHENILKYC